MLFLEAEAMNAFEFNYVWKHMFSYIYYDKQDKYTMDPTYLNSLQQFCQSISTFWEKKIESKKYSGKSFCSKTKFGK